MDMTTSFFESLLGLKKVLNMAMMQNFEVMLGGWDQNGS
jgi:hypothetical protein